MLLGNVHCIQIFYEFLFHQENYETRKTCQVYLFSVFVFCLQKCRFERLEVHQTCIYSKKTKVLIVKSHQTCIYSKKSKTNQKKQFIYASESHIESEIFVFWVYAGLVTFNYQNFLIFLSICRCCALLASKCCFFWVYAGLVNLKSLKPAFTQKKQTFW